MPEVIIHDKRAARLPADETVAMFADNDFEKDLRQLVKSAASACAEEVFEPRLRDALTRTQTAVGKTGERLDAGLQRLASDLDDLLKSAKKVDKEQQFRLSELAAQLSSTQRELLNLGRECKSIGKRLDDQILKLASQQHEAAAALTREQSAASVALTRQQREATAKLLSGIAELQRALAAQVAHTARAGQAQFWALLSSFLFGFGVLVAALFLRK